MSKNKSVSKSVRMTDEIFSYIDGYHGNGFNEKFENIILDAMLSEQNRIQTLQTLDSRITAQRDKLDALSVKLRTLEVIYHEGCRVQESIESLANKLQETASAQV